MVKVVDIGLLKPEHPIFSEGSTISTGQHLEGFSGTSPKHTDGPNPLDTEDWQRPGPRLSDVQEAVAEDVMNELVDAYQQGGKEAVANRFMQIMKEKREAEQTEDSPESHQG